MEIKVLYEDNETLVINKPVGLVVNRAESVSAPTVQDWIEKYLGIKYQVLSIKYGKDGVHWVLGIKYSLPVLFYLCKIIGEDSW